jgi:hypothetical protein
VTGVAYVDKDSDGEPGTPELFDNITVRFNDGTENITALTNATGAYEAFLELDRQYNITLYADFSIVDEDLDIITTMTENLTRDFKITAENITISGQTLSNQTAEPFTSIRFSELTASDDNITVISDTGGSYSLELAPGDYSVYARKVTASGVLTHLGTISIQPRQDPIFNINLDSSVKVTGMAYLLNSTHENLSAQVEVRFRDEGTVITNTDGNGRFEVWLPDANYDITANITTQEYGMNMTYSYKGFQHIAEDISLYLNLSKEKLYDVKLDWVEDAAGTIRQNQSISYNITIINTGNIEDTFNISSSGVPDWNLSIPDNFTLGIDQSTTFEVHIHTPENAKVDHGTIRINAVSRNDTSVKDDVIIEVDILQVFGRANISHEEGAIIAFNNTLEYILDLENQGNGLDNFSLEINEVPADWNATLSENEFELKGYEEIQIILTVDIPYNTSTTSKDIVLTTLSGQNLSSELVIPVYSSNLALEKDDLTITGDEVSEGELDTSTIPGFEVIILLVALLGVAVLMKRRDGQ